MTGVTFEYTTTRGGRWPAPGRWSRCPCDQVLVAIGQALRAEDLAGQGLALEKGRIAVDATGKTSLPGVWAGGDCVAGGLDLTVAAVEDGKRAAQSIHDVLTSSTNGKA